MKIVLKKVRVHNLKDVDLELEPNQFIVLQACQDLANRRWPSIRSMSKDKEDTLNLYRPMQEDIWEIFQNPMQN